MKVGTNYNITYEFKLSPDVENIKIRSIKYWESRKFKCNASIDKITGRRGNYFGNLTSFNMTKLICKLCVVLCDKKRIRTELFINGKFQDITNVNLWDFKLELILFHRYLNNLPFPDFMTDYKKYRRNSALKWTYTLMEKGRDLNAELKEKLEGLTEGECIPVVEVVN